MLSTITYCVKRLLEKGVEAWRHDGLRLSDPPVRVKHIVYHSPDGFECGYGGSGPADLALSILADFTDETERNPRRDRPGVAMRNHQEFKWRFIAGLSLRPGEEKYIGGNDIAAMLDQIEPEWRSEKPKGKENGDEHAS